MSGYRLSRAERELMVERLLRGEHAYAIAEDLGVDKTLPSLRAFTWGFIHSRAARVSESDLTRWGREWLAKRPLREQAAILPPERGAAAD